MNIKEIRDIEEMLDALEDRADDILTWCRAKRDEIEEIKAQKILRGNVINFGVVETYTEKENISHPYKRRRI